MRPLTTTRLHIYHPPAPACFHAGEQTLSATHELIAKSREPSRVEGLGEEVREVVVGVHLVNLDDAACDQLPDLEVAALDVHCAAAMHGAAARTIRTA